MERPSHIFVVGVGRSGTRYIKNILCSHPEINISVETHFFGNFIRNGLMKAGAKIGDMKDDGNVKRLVEKMFAKEIFGTFWKAGC